MVLGGSDCEAWRPGLLHQPVNALSSLAYLAAGAWIATRPAPPGPGPGAGADRARGRVFALAVAGNGLGSLLYHGPQYAGSAVVHDVAVPAALLFVVADDLALLRGSTVRQELAGYAVAVGAAGALVAVVPAASVVVTGVCLAAAVVAEVALARRRGRPDGWSLLVVTALAAGLTGAAGRTGSPFCRPYSLLQGHALWHVLSAATLVGWDRMRRTRRT